MYKGSFNQLVVDQTQRRRKERGFSGRHSLDVVHEELWIPFCKVLVQELDLHVHDRVMTKEVKSEQLLTEDASDGPTLQQMW